jgi:hypothetical protein
VSSSPTPPAADDLPEEDARSAVERLADASEHLRAATGLAVRLGRSGNSERDLERLVAHLFMAGVDLDGARGALAEDDRSAPAHRRARHIRTLGEPPTGAA